MGNKKIVKKHDYSITIVPPGKKKGLDALHGERIEHARSLFVQELKSLKIKSVDEVMRKWGVELFPLDSGKGFFSTIAYANDFPIEKRLYESEIQSASEGGKK